MLERPHIDLIELDVEPLSFTRGTRTDPLVVVRRWWDAPPVPGTGPPAAAGPADRTAATTVLTGSTSFWRIVDVPGDQLGGVLDVWWQRSSHDAGRLLLERPRGLGGGWQLAGSLRVTPLSRRTAVTLSLWPHARFWSMLEMTPRRRLAPSRRYFRAGHDALDQFARALRDLAPPAPMARRERSPISPSGR